MHSGMVSSLLASSLDRIRVIVIARSRLLIGRSVGGAVGPGIIPAAARIDSRSSNSRRWTWFGTWLGIALIALVVAGGPLRFFPGACHVGGRIHARLDASYDRL